MTASSGAEHGEADEPEPPGQALSANKADLLRGLLCVGKKTARTMLTDPGRRTSEVRGLAGLLDAYVVVDEAGPRTSGFFDELDSREKASFSYRFGMGLALLMAQRHLEVPWLMHAEALLAAGSAEATPEGSSRTELVGLGRDGRWHVVKARARSSELTASIVDDTLDSVTDLAQVNGQPPASRRACVAGLGQAPFRVSFAGPEEPEPEREGEVTGLRVDPSRYITEYYAQFTFLTSLDTKRRKLEDQAGCGNLPPVVGAELGDTGYGIGLLAPLYDALLPSENPRGGEETLDEAVPDRGGWAPEDPQAARAEGLSVGRDGVVVEGPAPGES